MNEQKQRKNWQLQIEEVINKNSIQAGVVILILLNAMLLGMETSPSIMSSLVKKFTSLISAISGIFICELILLMLARGLDFFKDPWCLFDFIVISIALIPASESLSVLRSLRVLRVLRLIGARSDSMRRVVRGLYGFDWQVWVLWLA
jgi:voltage-gated sodium channel